MIATICRSCRAPIIWIKTPAGKNMPCDAKKVEATEELLGRGRLTLVLENGVVVPNAHVGQAGYISHFATCPQANDFRK